MATVRPAGQAARAGAYDASTLPPGRVTPSLRSAGEARGRPGTQ